jgi:hypothetical protein
VASITKLVKGLTRTTSSGSRAGRRVTTSSSRASRLQRASAKTTFDTYGHLRPDWDESTRATIEAVFVTRLTEQSLNQQGTR